MYLNRLLLIFIIFFEGMCIDIPNGKSTLILINSAEGNITSKIGSYPLLSHPNDPQKGMVIIPADYYAKPQMLNAEINTPSESTRIDLDIIDAEYPTEILSVDSAKVTPPEDVLERIAAEKAEAEAIYSRRTPHRYWNKPFIRPIQSITTSAYGSARTYNGTLKSYHGGIDFRALTPLPILASNDGVVVLSKDRYYAGGSVVIDHGEGLFSTYYHLSRMDVTPGQFVQRGDAIGLSGATGRITGPHLHFGMMIHSLQTDPLYLMDQLNNLFPKE